MQGGSMSGVLRNASAAVSYARGAIFGIRGDIRNLFHRTAPPLERVMSGGFLGFKLAVVAVISFAIYQEWQQHIISQTEIAAAQAQKFRAEADVAKPFNNAQVRKLEPEAAVSKEVNEAHPPSSAQPTPSSIVSNAPQPLAAAYAHSFPEGRSRTVAYTLAVTDGRPDAGANTAPNVGKVPLHQR